MSSALDKRTTIVELFKAGNSRQDISERLKVNRMLVWKTSKRYEVTGDNQNRSGPDRPKTARTLKLVKSTREKIRGTPRDPSRIWQKSQMCRMEPCQLFY